ASGYTPARAFAVIRVGEDVADIPAGVHGEGTSAREVTAPNVILAVHSKGIAWLKFAECERSRVLEPEDPRTARSTARSIVELDDSALGIDIRAVQSAQAEAEYGVCTVGEIQ